MHVWQKFVKRQDIEQWDAFFYESGMSNIAVTDSPGRKNVRVEVYCETKTEANRLKSDHGGSVRILKNANWAAMAPPPIRDIRIRDALLITSKSAAGELRELKNACPTRQVISVPPNLAFGTGNHATTATCLRMLVDVSRKLAGDKSREDWELLDLGTGTGILAIAARMLGAGRVLACDFDARALAIARQNVSANHVTTGIDFREADVTQWSPDRNYACVVANMFSDVLIAAFPQIAAAVDPGGALIISGILRQQEPAVLRAGRQEGVRFERIVRCGKWVTALGKRRLSSSPSVSRT